MSEKVVNHIIVDGEVFECKTYLETLEKFLERWKLKLEEIRNNALDEKQCKSIARGYIEEALHYFRFSNREFEDTQGVLKQLYHEIILAIYFSYSKYKKENRTFWSFFWKDKLKLPDFHFHKH